MNMFAVCGLHPNLAETLSTQIVEQEPTGNIKKGQCQIEQIPSTFLDLSRANRLVIAVNILISMIEVSFMRALFTMCLGRA